MRLSPRAQKYLRTLKRKSWQASSEATSSYLRKQGIEPTPELLYFQANYSGLILTIKNDGRSTFEASLFSVQDVVLSRQLDLSEVEGRYIFDCGTHATAQINFFLTDRGEICTWEDDDILNIIYSSFDKFIEEYAMRCELVEWYENPGYYELINVGLFNTYVGQGCNLLKDCSDEYNSWWANDELIIHKGIWLDRPEYYLHIYANSVTHCKELTKALSNSGILK